MILKKTLFTIFLFSFLFNSCETDIDLFTDSDQIPVVFALLEPANPVQYFRINPTFIGEGDARVIAGNPVLTNYKEGEIEVKLIDVTRNMQYILKDSVGLIDIDGDGIFNEKNRIYYLNTPVQVLQDGTIINDVLIAFNDYQLRIENTKTGAITISDIKLGDINKLRMVFPKKGISQFPFDWLNFYTSTEYNSSYTFKFAADALSERFLMEMRYYYTGLNQDKDSKDSLVQFEVGEVNEIEAFGLDKQIEMDFNGERFYSILQNKLPWSTERTGQTSDLVITAVGSDLDIYVSVQNSSLTSISQEKPGYSNVENGLGIFSYRLERTFPEYKLNLNSAEQLFNGPYTIERFHCARYGYQGSGSGNEKCRN